MNKINKLQEKILETFGNNSTGNCEIANDNIKFNEVILSDKTKTSEFYTHEGSIYIITNQGMDLDFIDFSVEDQKLLYNSMIN